MNTRGTSEYMFYTAEGTTWAPNKEVSVNNCQILGFVEAKNLNEAKKILLRDNPWIETSGFSMGEMMVKQILNER